MRDRSALVIVTPGFAADEADSTCMPSQQNLIRAFNRIRPELDIVILSLQYPYRRATYRWFGNEVVTFNGKTKNWLKRGPVWIDVIRVLNHLRKKRNIIGLLSFWCGEAAIISHWFSRRHNIPHHSWVLGQDARKPNSAMRLMKLHATELVAISSFVQNEFQRNHKIKPAYVFENGLIARSQVNEIPRTIDIIGVGSLTQLKQYEIFIEVIKKLKSSGLSTRAVICGQGPEQSVLQAAINENNLVENVTLAGELNHEDVLTKLESAKVLIHPSQYEGYSTACLEALNAGCYVISFTSPGNVNTDRWQVVNNTDEMVKRCKDILSDQRSEYKQVMLNSIDNTAQQFLELYLRESKTRKISAATASAE